MGVIVNTEGRPIFDEVASITRDLRRVFYGGVQFNDDDTLKARGGAKGLKIYQELKTDAHAGAVLAKRKLAVTARPWDVHPASEKRRDKAAAELVKKAFEALKFNSVRKRLLEATLTGYAVSEVMWEVRDGLVLPRTVKARDPRRFLFTTEDDLRLLTREKPLEGEPLPDRKFIVHRRGADDDSPYGTGIGSMLFWPVFFKRNGITFWLTFADKFGAPTLVGKYPTGDSDAQKKLMAAMRAVSHDAGVTVPEGTMIELLEAKRSGGVDTYAALVSYMDEQISKAVLGETMSTTAQAAGMGSGQANVHNDVRMEVARDDAGELDETLTDSLARWIVHYNMPDAGVPKVCTVFDEPEDTAKLADRDSKLVQMGWEPSEQYMQETYGEGWTRKALPAPMPAAPTAVGDPAELDSGGEADPNAAGGDGLAEDPQGEAAAFADPAGAPLGKVSAQRGFQLVRKEAISQAAEQLAGDWQAVMRGPVEDLLAQFESSNDLVEFRLRLTQLLDRKPDPATVDKLAKATFASHVQGRGPASQAQQARSRPGVLTRLMNAVRGR